MTCLDMTDYQLVRHWLELTDEVAQRRAVRPFLIGIMEARAQRDITQERQETP